MLIIPHWRFSARQNYATVPLSKTMHLLRPVESQSKPQYQRILNLSDALLVCDDKKTLAALHRQFIEAPDVSNMASAPGQPTPCVRHCEPTKSLGSPQDHLHQHRRLAGRERQTDPLSGACGVSTWSQVDTNGCGTREVQRIGNSRLSC